MIYLASPFTHSDPAIVQQRVMYATKKAAELMNQGYDVYSPITFGECVVRHGCQIDHERWLNHGLNMLKLCDELWIYCQQGWAESEGVVTELQYAKAWGIPWDFLTDEKGLIYENENRANST